MPINAIFVHTVNCLFDAFAVVCRQHNFRVLAVLARGVFHQEINRVIVRLVRVLNAVMNRVGVFFLFSELPFLFHVGSTYQFRTKVIVEAFRTFHI